MEGFVFKSYFFCFKLPPPSFCLGIRQLRVIVYLYSVIVNFLNQGFCRDEKPYAKTLIRILKNPIFVNSEKLQTALISKRPIGIASKFAQ